MTRIALIGGTGSTALIPAHGLAEGLQEKVINTPYGEPSGPILSWTTGASEVLFISRHGRTGNIPPHRVNYRANLWAIASLKPDYVVGVNTVGGISRDMEPGNLVVPHQLIDYTWGREHTFADGPGVPLRHIEFDPPFSGGVREALLQAGRASSSDPMAQGTYGVTQGPRLETAAEIDRLASDGCDVVGMTAMPEAALARELDLRYAILAVVVNRAAGRLAPGASIHGDLQSFLAGGMAKADRLLRQLLAGRPDRLGL